jgi:hypothetical protein
MLEGLNFAKDYKKDSYNKIIFIEKNIENKNILAHIQKTLILLKMWNFENLKNSKNVSKLLQNCRILKVLYHI